MVKIMRVIILMVFMIIAIAYAVPDPTFGRSKGLFGLLKGKSDCEKPKEPDQCDGGGDGGSPATAVAISSAKSDGGKGKALAKSVAVAESDSKRNGDGCDD